MRVREMFCFRSLPLKRADPLCSLNTLAPVVGVSLTLFDGLVSSCSELRARGFRSAPSVKSPITFTNPDRCYFASFLSSLLNPPMPLSRAPSSRKPSCTSPEPPLLKVVQAFVSVRTKGLAGDARDLGGFPRDSLRERIREKRWNSETAFGFKVLFALPPPPDATGPGVGLLHSRRPCWLIFLLSFWDLR